MKLTEVKYIGYAYFHRFRMEDGSLLEIETTEKDYRQLGQPNPQNPSKDGANWECSYERLKFDTPDGLLSDNCWANVENRYKVGKIQGFEMQSVTNDKIDSDGNIDKSMLQETTKL